MSSREARLIQEVYTNQSVQSGMLASLLERIPVRLVMALFTLGAMTFSKAPVYHVRISAMAPIAFVAPFCHGSHGIFPCRDLQN